MALNGFHIVIEPGAENPHKHTPPPELEPPEGFVDNTVYRYRIDEDGNKVLIGTMEAFPEGWDDPHKLREKRFQKQSKEEEAMVKPLENREELIRRAKALMQDGLSLTKAAREVGIGTSTLSVWLKKERQAANPEPAAAANQEPERESQESAETSVAQEEPLAQREQGFGPEDEEPIPYQVAEDATLDEMKVIWIENVLTHCTQAKTQLQYIQAIMDLRV